MSAGSTSRVLAIWCMDWPAVAAAAAAGLPPTAPVAVTLANRVIACSASARAAGVRRGLRRREAQARCPQLHVVTADPGARCPPLRRRDGSGGRPGAARRGAAARPAGVAGARCGALLRVRAGRRRAVGRRGGRGRCRMPGRESPTSCPPRSSPRGPGGSSSRARTRCSCPRCPSGSWPPSRAWPRPGREDLADLLWRMGIRNIGQFAALSRSRCGLPVRRRCGRRAPLRPRRTRAAGRRGANRRRNSTP